MTECSSNNDDESSNLSESRSSIDSYSLSGNSFSRLSESSYEGTSDSYFSHDDHSDDNSGDDDYDDGDESSIHIDASHHREIISTIRRRKAVQNRNRNAHGDIINNDREDPIHYDDSSRRHHRRRNGTRTLRENSVFRCSTKRIVNRNRATSMMLATCFLLWLTVQVMYSSTSYLQNLSGESAGSRRTNHGVTHQRKESDHSIKSHLKASALGVAEGYLKGVVDQFRGLPENPEAMPPGCTLQEWQHSNFPNCNDIHEFAMTEFLAAIKPRRYYSKIEHEPPDFLGKGLWRAVWQVAPRNDPHNPDERVVIKFMKQEHDVDVRNLERHRRDAVVMEHLSSSPNVASIYSFCGNTVFSECVENDLDKYCEKLSAAENTERKRVEISLGAARGVAALHADAMSPIVHADIQAKQFLVDKQGQIKINDFNRCRFLPHKNGTSEKCPVRIPSAPGIYRSPEEYGLDELDEKIDIYSLANVMYLILTGRKPWNDVGYATAKKQIQRGKIPPLPTPTSDGESNSTDFKLAVLITRAYALDPEERISAQEMVFELEKLLNKAKSAN